MPTGKTLRSRDWFDNPDMPGMTALYLERYLNYGLTREELQSNRPVIGIAQTGSDLAPCNRLHLTLATRVKEGIRDAGGIPLEFPVHPIQETGRRPTAALDRNLQSISLIEVLHGYPLDGVVLTTGCDKTTGALLMGAASVNLPAIALSVGPMLNGYYLGNCVGSGSIIWAARRQLSSGEITKEEFMELVAGSSPSAGHCNTMGTALTMNCLTEALGMTLPGCASIPAPYRERQQMAYLTGKRSVEIVWEELTPGRILGRKAFTNAIAVCAAIGGSTNAPIHINAIARHANVPLDMSDWQEQGQQVPLLVNCQPAGEQLAEDFHRAGGLPAVINEMLKAGLLYGDQTTVSGNTLSENYAGHGIVDARTIKTVREPLQARAGFMVFSGNLFESALMKVSVIDQSFRDDYLSDADDPDAFEGEAVVFDGPEDYHARINDPSLRVSKSSILIMRGAGPVAYPGSAEVVNMQPPDALIRQGIPALPTIGDGRQSGTSAAPSILNASPEAAVGGNLAILQNGDRIRIDLNKRRVDVLIDDAEIARRHKTFQLRIPEHQTWWQQLYRQHVSSLSTGAVFDEMLAYRDTAGIIPRHSH
ncbi:MAG: dihydroxy-acid dehydratase family protein [Gammaproteobacteria bacterium]|nr:dihydroxy-acid dehydratase family protein [Gammaproteobacteria bacterium]